MLTTASVLAVTASAGSAFGGTAIENVPGLPPTLTANAGANLRTAAVPAVAVANYVNGSSFRFSDAGQLLTINNGVANTVDLAGFAQAAGATVGGAATISSVVDSKGNNKLNVVVQNGQTLTLKADAGIDASGSTQAGGVFTALGNITLGAGGAAILDVKAADAKLTGNINSNGNLGVINVNAKDVVFEGLVGNTQKVATMAISDANSATLAKAGLNQIDATTIGDGSQLTIRAGAHLTGLTIDSTVAAKGTLEFEGNSNVTVAKIGNIAALEEVKVTGSGVVDLKTAATYKAKTTTLGNNTAEMKFSLAGNVDIEGDFKTTTAGKGKLSLGVGANTAKIVGSIGEDGKALETVALTGVTTLHIQKDGASLHAGTVTSDAAANVVVLQGKDFVIDANIGTAAQAMAGGIQLRADNAGAAAATFTLKEGKSIFGNVDLAQNAALDNILVLEQETAITGNIITSNANSSILSVKGDAAITGEIGKGAAIKQIQFDTADKTLTVSKNAITTNDGIVFNADGALKLTEDANFTTNKAVTITTATAGGVGSISVDSATAGKLVEFNAAIGNVANANESLKLLSVKGGAGIELTANAAIEKIDIGDKDVQLELKTAGQSYMIGEFAHEDGKGTVRIDNNMTLKKGTSLSTSTKKLKEISLSATNGGDHTLTIEDGINLHAVNGIKNTGVNNKGLLIFEGDSTVDAVVGVINTFKGINVTGKGKTVNFEQKINLAGDLRISDDATAILHGEVVAAKITGAVVNQGTVVFQNNSADLAAATAVTAAVGANTLDTVRILGKNVEFKNAAGTFDTKNLEFESANEVTVNFAELAADSLENTKITTNSKNKEHNIIINKGAGVAVDHKFGEIASAANQFGNITFGTGNDKIFTFTNANSYASVQTIDKTKGELVVANTVGTTTIRGFGSSTLELRLAEFDNNTIVLEDAHADTININAGKTVTFNGVVNGITKFEAQNNSVVNFGSGAVLESNLTTLNAGNGVVNVNDSATIKGDIGTNAKHFSRIEFNANDSTKVASVFSNLNADNINIGKHTLKAENNFTLDGAVTVGDGAVVDLGSKNVTLQGGVASRFVGNNAMKMELLNDKTTGKVTVTGAGTSLDLSGSKLAIEIIDTQDLPTANETYTLFETTANGALTPLVAGNGTATAAGRQFVEYDIVHDTTTNNLNLVRKNVASAKLQEAVANLKNAQLSADAARYGNSENTGDARAYVNDIDKMTDAQLEDSLQRVTSTGAVHATEAVRALDESLTNTINNRMGALSNHPQPGVQLASGQGAGVSAGEGDHTMYGAWFSPFYNTTTQKKRSGNSGFKSNSYGATLGFDVQANADLTVGVAGSYAKTDIKHKDFKSGDKTKMDTFMFSVYGIQQLTDTWFLQGNAAFSSSKVKNTEKMVTSTGTETAKGAFDVTSYTAEMLAGYNHKMDNVVVTPLLGASFSRTNAGGYKETGTTNQNRNISRKASNRFEAILGLRAQMTTDMDGIEVTPEIHGFVKHDLIAKNAKVSAKHSGLVGGAADRSAKAHKTTFNAGVGVNAVSGMYEYGAGYDLFAGDKTLGHQGTLKVRVNF